MSKITIPCLEVEIGGSLQSWYYNNCILRTDVTKQNDGVNATAINGFNLSISEVNNILSAHGEVEEYLMAVKAPISIMGTNVPSSLPNYRKLDDNAALVSKQFSDWLVPGAEIWLKDDNTEVIFYTNPFAGNENQYLTGSQIKVINDISPANIDILTITEAQVETASGWTKL